MKRSFTSLATSTVIVFAAVLPAMAADQMADEVGEFFAKDGQVVTEDNYPMAESERQMLVRQTNAGINKFDHKRELTPTDDQDVVRMNRDTYYSFATINVSQGAKVIMPEIPEGKYMSIMGITLDHRIQPMQYGPGEFNLSTHTGDHIYLVVRLDSTFTQEEANAIQDQMKIVANSNATLAVEPYDEVSFDAVETELKAAMPALLKEQGKEALNGMFTDFEQKYDTFNDRKWKIGSAVGWGGALTTDNVYEISGNMPSKVCHQATFEDPLNEAFWSVTVYDADGFMFGDFANLSSDTAETNKDGTTTLSFGCGKDAINNIPTANKSGEFNLAVRHYQRSEKVADGYRVLPFVKPVE
ncbi:MAG: DUF1254 domain-containing protein [Shimia sp.]|uniref:DUF1254 domain-containing protein n=1 Tax=Shimia sp. TaxID=1954381 RepID=UPI00405817D1